MVVSLVAYFFGPHYISQNWKAYNSVTYRYIYEFCTLIGLGISDGDKRFQVWRCAVVLMMKVQTVSSLAVWTTKTT